VRGRVGEVCTHLHDASLVVFLTWCRLPQPARPQLTAAMKKPRSRKALGGSDSDQMLGMEANLPSKPKRGSAVRAFHDRAHLRLNEGLAAGRITPPLTLLTVPMCVCRVAGCYTGS
jgi:hypothetical protein